VNIEDVCRKKYLSEYLRDGRLERWYTEIFEGLTFGVLGYCSTGVVRDWKIGKTVYLSIGMRK
jgi:hypothetical protein